MIAEYSLEGISFNATSLSRLSLEQFTERCVKERTFSNYSPADQKKLIELAFAGIKSAVDGFASNV